MERIGDNFRPIVPPRTDFSRETSDNIVGFDNICFVIRRGSDWWMGARPLWLEFLLGGGLENGKKRREK